ncbi:neurotrimin-like isoform X2 [Vespula maculifrons]|uniref:Neurotrimin-like isoform X2 n=1 Tax=Vespula maculifrons TaxID=7453 RepID=A0ABD2AMP1_VESMC
MDLEIFAFAEDFENLSPRVDLEIFALPENFENIYLHEGSQPTSMSTYLIFNQLQIIHPQFRPKSRSSVLEPPQNFLSIVVRVRSKEEAMCRRGPHNLWLKRATIRLLKINNIHSGSHLTSSNKFFPYFFSKVQLNPAIVRTTESALNKSAHGNETRTFKYIAYSRFTLTGRIPNRIPVLPSLWLHIVIEEPIIAGPIIVKLNIYRKQSLQKIYYVIKGPIIPANYGLRHIGEGDPINRRNVRFIIDCYTRIREG